MGSGEEHDEHDEHDDDEHDDDEHDKNDEHDEDYEPALGSITVFGYFPVSLELLTKISMARLR